MSVLVVAFPPRPRAGSSEPAPTSWHYVLSANGQQVERAGVAALDLLPRADTLVAALPASETSFQRLALPRAPASRLRAALAGALEDTLLEDAETLHFALPIKSSPGAETWVAVTRRNWLAEQIAALEAGGRTVDRVVPALAPAEPDGPAAPGQASGQSRGHFTPGITTEGDDPAAAPLRLALATAAGCCELPLAGSLAGAGAGPALRGLLPADGTLRWTATPQAAAAAEHWLGVQGLAARVELVSDAEHQLALLASPWNLRQFDLLPQLRGARALQGALRRLASPAWRPFRWGVVALVVLQLIGLNAWAWQQQRTLQAQRDAVVTLLKSTHPQVRAVLDAPQQMQRENDRLRYAAGRAGDADFETLLAATAAAWPDGLASAQSLRFEGGQLFVVAPGAGAAQADALRERLRGQGLTAQFADNRLRIEREARR